MECWSVEAILGSCQSGVSTRLSRRHGAGSERQTSVHRDAGDIERALDVMRQALTDWQGMLRQETGPARRAMQALLKGRLVFTPRERDGERFYTFEGEGTISPVIAGTTEVQRVWWPQRDSNPCFSLERAVSWASRRWGRPAAR